MVSDIVNYLGMIGASMEEPLDEDQASAADPRKLIDAIKTYRAQTGLGLREAKEVVERAQKKSQGVRSLTFYAQIFLLFSFLVSPALSADFRGSEFDASCLSIPERELALGSTELGDPSLLNQHRFAGTAFGRAVTITYLCNDGLLKVGDYHFGFHFYDDAVADFHLAYSKLLALYGIPSREYSPDAKDESDKMFPRAGDSPRKFIAEWSKPGIFTSLVMWIDEKRPSPNWQVFMVVTADRKQGGIQSN